MNDFLVHFGSKIQLLHRNSGKPGLQNLAAELVSAQGNRIAGVCFFFGVGLIQDVCTENQQVLPQGYQMKRCIHQNHINGLRNKCFLSWPERGFMKRDGSSTPFSYLNKCLAT